MLSEDKKLKIQTEIQIVQETVSNKVKLKEVNIDKYELNKIVEDKTSENTNNESCQPRKNLVYLKTHKTASSAVQV